MKHQLSLRYCSIPFGELKLLMKKLSLKAEKWLNYQPLKSKSILGSVPLNELKMNKDVILAIVMLNLSKL